MILSYDQEKGPMVDGRAVFELTDEGLRAGEAWNELTDDWRYGSEQLAGAADRLVAAEALKRRVDPFDAGEHLVDVLEPPLDEVGRTAFLAGVQVVIDQRREQRQ